MAYKRIPPPKVPVNLWEFKAQNGTTKDDLVKISFDNGDELFVRIMKHPTYRHEMRWVVDPKLMPASLCEYAKGDQCPVIPPGLDHPMSFKMGMNGCVGYRMFIALPGGHWKTDWWFMTEGKVTSIRPAKRTTILKPTQLAGTRDSFTSRDYH